MMETGYDPAAAITDKMWDMTADEMVKVVRELCAQLGDDADSFHGNIWPNNIRIDWDGKAVLGEASDVPANRREAEQVEYLAPEFFWDNEGSAASDVYSLGLLLYAACSGGFLPFQPRGGLLTSKDRSNALRKRMKGEPIAPPDKITPELAAVIRKALTYEPEERYISAAALLRALNETDEALPAPETDAAPKEERPETPDAPEEEQPKPVLTAGEPEAAPAYIPAAPEDINWLDAVPEEAPNGETPDDLPAETPREPADIAPEKAPEETADIAPAEAPAEEPLPEPPEELVEEAALQPEEPRYTVRKDFEHRAAPRAAVPKDNRKKKTSPIIPVLCAAAVLVIAAAAVILRPTPADTAPESADRGTVTYTIEPTLSTDAPEPAEVTPSLGDDELAEIGTEAEAEPNAEAEAEAEEENEPAEGAPVGSAMIDGLTVEPADDTVEIIDTGTNLRTGPSTSYAIAESLPRGVRLVRTGTVNGWSQVHYEGGEYYVASNLVAVVEIPPETQTADAASPAAPGKADGAVGTLIVTADVNIRSGPGTEYDKIGEAKVGAVLSAIGRSDDGKWYLISTADGEGYVNRRLVSVRDYAQLTAAEGTLKVLRDVNLRVGPGTGYEVIALAEAGDTLTLTGTSDSGWYRIDYNGRTAFLAGEYAEIS